MDPLALELLAASVGVGLVHTLAGPDHYVPFVTLARARAWSARRTLAVTAACGLGHVGSSLALGLVGVALGVSVGGLDRAEGARGDLAAWLLVAFGVAYGAWGMRRAWRARRGLELHAHGAQLHVHAHGVQRHEHGSGRERRGTSWALFVIFVLGPCEPLVPLVLLPASRGRWGLAAATATLYGLTTVLSMVAVVLAGRAGLARVRWRFLERWSHALAGGVVAASGLAVLFAGL